MSHSAAKTNTYFSVGSVLEENQSPIILSAYAIVVAVGIAYLFYSPQKVRNIQLFHSAIFDIIPIYYDTSRF